MCFFFTASDQKLAVFVFYMPHYRLILLDYLGVKENLVLPDGVRYIIDNAFAGYVELRTVVVPGCYYSIPHACFIACYKMTDITIQEGVTYIAGSAFEDCWALKEVYVPNTVDEMSTRIFKNCESLTTVHLSEHNEEESYAGVILSNTFDGCKELTSITLHINTRWIGVNAFINCPKLTDVYYEGTKAQWEAITIQGTNSYTFTIHCTDDDISW